MKIARLPDGTRLAFDDSAPQSEIDATVRRYLEATRSDKTPSSIVVNVPKIDLPESPEIKVEVVSPISPKLEEAMATLGSAMGEMKELRSSIEKLCNVVEKNTKSVQTEIRAAVTVVVTQMKLSSDSISTSANELRSTLEKDKVFSFDTSGNPTRISVEK